MKSRKGRAHATSVTHSRTHDHLPRGAKRPRFPHHFQAQGGVTASEPLAQTCGKAALPHGTGGIFAAMGGPILDAGKFRPHSLVRSPGLLSRCVRTYRGEPIQSWAALRHAVPVRAPAHALEIQARPRSPGPRRMPARLRPLGSAKTWATEGPSTKTSIRKCDEQRDWLRMQQSRARGISRDANGLTW